MPIRSVDERSIRDPVYCIGSPFAVPTGTQIGGKHSGDGGVLPVVEQAIVALECLLGGGVRRVHRISSP